MTRVEVLRGNVLPEGVVHGFTGRAGGTPPHGLTLARREGLDDAVLVEHWRRALAAVDPRLRPEALALARQVHGARVVLVDAPTGPLGDVGEADALVTTVPGLALAVRVADCVPVVIGAPGGVAAVHAGWRGAAAGIAPAAVERLAQAAGVAPAAMGAVLGPAISGPRYEVGPEVVEAIEASGVPRHVFAEPGRGDRWHADVRAAVAWQLRAAGVGAVEVTDGCTSEPRFFSWRAEGPAAGRQAGIVAWCP